MAFLFRVVNELKGKCCIVPSWSSDLSTLPNRKLPMVLSHLSEISGDWKDSLSLSFWSNLKFFKMMFLSARLWGQWVKSERKWNSLVFFLRDVCSADGRSLCWTVLTTALEQPRFWRIGTFPLICWKIGVITQTLKSKKLRMRDGFLYVRRIKNWM